MPITSRFDQSSPYPMKIIFFGTANVALPILEKLNNSHEVLAVVTSPDAPVGRSSKPEESPVSALAKDLKLPLLKPEKVKENNEFLQSLKNLNADIFEIGRASCRERVYVLV